MVKISCWKHCSHLLCLLSLQYMQRQPTVAAHVAPFLSVIDPQKHLPITSIYGLYNLILTVLLSSSSFHTPSSIRPERHKVIFFLLLEIWEQCVEFSLQLDTEFYPTTSWCGHSASPKNKLQQSCGCFD